MTDKIFSAQNAIEAATSRIGDSRRRIERLEEELHEAHQDNGWSSLETMQFEATLERC